MFWVPVALWSLLMILPLLAEIEQTPPTESILHLEFMDSSIQDSTTRGVTNEVLGVVDVSLTNELFDTPSLRFEAVGGEIAQDAVFAKIKSVRVADERVFWRGRTTSGPIGYATIVQDPGGEIGGFVSLDSMAYELIQIHDGSIRCVAVESSSLPQAVEDYRSTGLFSFLEEDTSDDIGEVPMLFQSRMADSTTSIEAANQDVTCEEVDDDLIAVVDVLLVVTHDAMCQYAFQESPCDLVTHRGAIDRLLALDEFNTNEAIQGVGVQVSVSYIDTVYIASGFRTPATTTTLDFVSFSTDIKERRELVGADLVAFIGTRDPLGAICGIAQIGGVSSVTSVFCVGSGVLTHELGHNFGCMHHPSDTFFDTLRIGYIVYLNFYGYGFEDEETLSTIMSYGCESSYCPDIPYFSSDQCRYQGNVMGSSQKNNARKIRNRSVKISRRRERQEVDTPLATEITLFDTPATGLQCAPAEAGICEYGKSRLSYNLFYILCFGRCVDDGDTYFDFSFGIPFLSIIGEILYFVQAFFFCGPCKALLNI